MRTKRVVKGMAVLGMCGLGALAFGASGGSDCSVMLWNGSMMTVHCEGAPAGRYQTCFVSCSPSGKVTGVSCSYPKEGQEPNADPDCVANP